ncbi:MAG: hypothetical protein AAB582_00965 [Patescibacteria group bacterium]
MPKERARIESLEQAVKEAGFSPFMTRGPARLLGMHFTFECETVNDDDDVNPQETDHHFLLGTILGVQYDESINALRLAVSNRYLEMLEILEIRCDFVDGRRRWLVSIRDNEALDEISGEFALVPQP